MEVGGQSLTQISLPLGMRPGTYCTDVGTDAENLDPPGFDPQTVQPVACCCTDYTLPAQIIIVVNFMIMMMKLKEAYCL
jgi:hypothetical protein